jgi:hypothetical protein
MKYVLTKQVDADGVLRLALELGEADANKVVRVIVETVEAASDQAPLSDEEWSKRVENLAGKWLGDFERPPQGEFEKREEWP